MTPDRLVGPGELASYLSISLKTLGRWRRRGIIPAVKLPSGQWRYDLDAVEDVLVRRYAT